MHDICCIHIANITGDLAQTGLVDYAHILSRKQRPMINAPAHSAFLSDCELGTLTVPTDWPYVFAPGVTYRAMAAQFPQQKFIAHVKRIADEQGRSPVLVCHVGARTGAIVAPETLSRFPVVMVSHEFELLTHEQRIYRVAQMLEAERLLFTTAAEMDSALEAISNLKGPKAAEEVKKRSVVRPVPSNIMPPTSIRPHSERANDIVVFSTIRERKGLDGLPEIARSMQNDPYFKDRSIHLVGNVLTKNGGCGLEILKKLLLRTYTLEAEDIDRLTLKETVELAKVLEGQGRAEHERPLTPRVIAILSDDFVDRKIPLHIHLNLPDEAVGGMLQNNRYSFLPMPRGATMHSGTLAASLEYGMITFTCRSKLESPPASLQNGSIYILETAAEILPGIKAHEIVARNSPSYEQAIIDKGEDYRKETSWAGLAELINRLVGEAIGEFHQTPLVALSANVEARVITRTIT